MLNCATPSAHLKNSENNEINEPAQLENWKQELLNSCTTVSDLTALHLISLKEAQSLESISNEFKIRITPYYAQLIENSPDCPIRKQAIPHLNEKDPTLPTWATEWSQKIYGRPEPWHPDPIGDLRFQVAPRLTHRYSHRALLHVSSMCAVYCRFCFRKSHLNDDSRPLYEGGLQPAFNYLREHTEISELVLTGGDPLSLNDSLLEKIFLQVDSLPGVKTLRIHSRMAVTLPSRFTTDLLQVFNLERRFNLAIVSHFNHPKELSEVALKKLNHLRRAGVTLLNQSVLMKGVNNSVPTLRTLFQTLYENGVIPYYLHHPDWTPGTFHFRVNIHEGQRLMSELRGLISGPALPDYVLDIPQGLGKTSLLGSHLKKVDEYSPGNFGPDFCGSVYELSGPTTRGSQNSKSLYLDFAPSSGL